MNETPMEGVGELRVMGGEGDTKIIWNRANADEVAAARKIFDDLVAKGFTAFSVDRGGDKGERMKAFDPAAEKVILIPRMAGGR